jgi:hypothetical protein
MGKGDSSSPPPRDFKKTKFRFVGVKIFLKFLLFPLNLDDLAPELALKNHCPGSLY